MRKIERIFVHCTASNQKITRKQLENEFKARGWKSPGYHYVVFPDGKVEQLLDESKISNGVRGYNSTSINVAYVGGVDGKLKPVDNRTEAQKEALITLLSGLKQRYPSAHIMGHRDVWGKDPKKWQKWCPCFDAEEEYKNLPFLTEGLVKAIEPNKISDVEMALLIEPTEEPKKTLIGKIIKFIGKWLTKA